MNITPPHVSQNTKRQGGSAIDGRTTRHDGYQVSQRKREAKSKKWAWLGQDGWRVAGRLGTAVWKRSRGCSRSHAAAPQPRANAEPDTPGEFNPHRSEEKFSFEFSKHAFTASIPLRGPLHEMNLSLRKKYEEG